jgi:hypothetical protein
MNKRMPQNRGPRPGPQSKSGPGERSNKSSWYHRRWCPPYYYDYDWYDHDWYDYDWYDYDDNYLYAPPKKSNAPSRADYWTEDTDPIQEAYRRGFKDGWAAAMESMLYSPEPIAADNDMPPPPPQPPMPEPTPMSK